jgi:hypothetical protein
LINHDKYQSYIVVLFRCAFLDSLSLSLIVIFSIFHSFRSSFR